MPDIIYVFHDYNESNKIFLMESKLFSFGKRPKGCSKVFKTFR